MVAKGTNILTSKLPTDSLRTIGPSDGSLTPQFSRSIKPQFFAKEPPSPLLALCYRNLQNVKLRLDLVEIGSFYRHSDFT